jgi:hypothetical protein
MTSYEELFSIADRLETAQALVKVADAEQSLAALDTVAIEAGRAFSGSWLGYHSQVYYADLEPPPPGAHFSQEWGLMDVFGSLGSEGEWREHDPDELQAHYETKRAGPILHMPTLLPERQKPNSAS